MRLDNGLEAVTGDEHNVRLTASRADWILSCRRLLSMVSIYRQWVSAPVLNDRGVNSIHRPKRLLPRLARSRNQVSRSCLSTASKGSPGDIITAPGFLLRAGITRAASRYGPFSPAEPPGNVVLFGRLRQELTSPLDVLGPEPRTGSSPIDEVLIARVIVDPIQDSLQIELSIRVGRADRDRDHGQPLAERDRPKSASRRRSTRLTRTAYAHSGRFSAGNDGPRATGRSRRGGPGR